MWSRVQLKDKAKVAFNRNYWMVVLVSAIFIFLGGGNGSVSFSVNLPVGYNNESDAMMDNYDDYNDNYGDIYDDYYDEVEDGNNAADPFTGDSFETTAFVVVIIIFVAIFMGIFGCVFISASVMRIFVINPLRVGGTRFFFKNLYEKANIKELGFVFKGHYMNVVKNLFFYDLYIALWTLLFIIPGMVKSYEYRMVPYLLAENPNLSRKEVFALSKKMMYGQKWNAFVLDLSFIGWDILSIFTLGILGIFYVAPYKNMTNAALYEALCYSGHNLEYAYTTESNTYAE